MRRAHMIFHAYVDPFDRICPGLGNILIISAATNTREAHTTIKKKKKKHFNKVALLYIFFGVINHHD